METRTIGNMDALRAGLGDGYVLNNALYIRKSVAAQATHGEYPRPYVGTWSNPAWARHEKNDRPM